MKSRAEVVAVFNEALVKRMTELCEAGHVESLFKELVADVHKNKEQLAKQLLGVDSRWGRMEIDHCNGRLSALDQAITERWKNHLFGIVDEEIEKTLRSIQTKPDHPARKAIRAEIASHWNSYKTKELVQAKMNKVLDSLFEEQMDSFRKELGL